MSSPRPTLDIYDSNSDEYDSEEPSDDETDDELEYLDPDTLALAEALESHLRIDPQPVEEYDQDDYVWSREDFDEMVDNMERENERYLEGETSCLRPSALHIGVHAYSQALSYPPAYMRQNIQKTV